MLCCILSRVIPFQYSAGWRLQQRTGSLVGSWLVPGVVSVRAGSEDAAPQRPSSGMASCWGHSWGTAGCQGQQCWAATPPPPRRSAPQAPRLLGSTAIEIGIADEFCKSVFGVGSKSLKHYLFYRNIAMVKWLNENHNNNCFLRRH